MTFSQMILVSYLWENREKKITQKDISEALHIKHPTTIGLLKRLEEKEMNLFKKLSETYSLETIPIIIVVLICQKRIISGLTSGAIKG